MLPMMQRCRRMGVGRTMPGEPPATDSGQPVAVSRVGENEREEWLHAKDTLQHQGPQRIRPLTSGTILFGNVKLRQFPPGVLSEESGN